LRHFGGGVLVLTFLLTFEWPWREIGWHYWSWHHVGSEPWRALPDAVLGGLIPLAAICLLVMTMRRRTTLGLLFGLAPVLAVGGYALASLTETYALSAGLFDVYLLTAGLWLLVAGIRTGRQGQMNLGLLAITALIVARFFDTDLNFLLRGLIFIALGLAFLVTNVIMLRRKGAAHE
jgi:hypothetical protein